MAHFVNEAIMWIVIGIFTYCTYKADKTRREADKARREYERKAQRAVAAVEGWRDAYLKVYHMRSSEEGGEE
ncbi:hypothetical protein KGP40_04395 [Weissella cibaria]|uniref:hypothetical protein n=1 Tax=Weissella cibaria TaxID=137591 RepID=UPI001C1F85C3|nr:hypothetical protein [Weissella cibaria]MBU7561155.1 hypothetical protein [Weissella cibaria]